MLQGCIGKMNIFKRGDSVVKSIYSGPEYDMVLNKTLGILSDSACGGCDFQGKNRILLYLKLFKNCLYVGRSL